MSLPAYDNFNRAGPALGANWTGSVGSDPVITGSVEVMGVSGQDSSAYWSADAPDQAQYAQVKISTYHASQFAGPLVRASATDWVLLDIYSAGYRIEWYHAAAWTVIGSLYSTTPATNDVGKITADGTAFKAYQNGTERCSGSNASAPSTGYGGLYLYSTAGQLDDFEVGNLAGGGERRWLFGAHRT